MSLLLLRWEERCWVADDAGWSIFWLRQCCFCRFGKKAADVWGKSTDDVAVIFDFLYDVFADDAGAFRLAELPFKRRLADAVVKARLFGKSRLLVIRVTDRLAITWLTR
ncbi:hypothetical protein KDW19_02480 [Burkholderia cenocepacia]|uniref:hypothetical protein n=1 Tax=Burkholderia cepacia complex TaxID=87882 RepID=UPI000F5B2DCB|nr:MULTISPECIES: hypothetical protein [Burkholderia cepacia complex]ELW9450633.1 hypothetical protein [Burkholderia cenocepacia]MBR8481320.1 hypothetical protein [Burkholderia cenocepacia]MDN7466745.1 hypothetical protein [Burkholderia orbicola]MDN7502210.1 hypothetical protein [Burkholderia orbicola]